MASRNATFSPGWGDGLTPCALLNGQTTDQFGRALAPANLSARQADNLGLLTSGIYGPQCTTSPRSAALRQFAESRFRPRTALLGSTLYKLTWKDWATPSGRSFSLLRASAQRISGTEAIGSGWPTAQARDWKGPQGGAYLGEHIDLPGATKFLAGWPTPTAGNAEGSQIGKDASPTGRRPDG